MPPSLCSSVRARPEQRSRSSCSAGVRSVRAVEDNARKHRDTKRVQSAQQITCKCDRDAIKRGKSAFCFRQGAIAHALVADAVIGASLAASCDFKRVDKAFGHKAFCVYSLNYIAIIAKRGAGGKRLVRVGSIWRIVGADSQKWRYKDGENN